MAELQFQSREETKKARELEEARKAGLIPAEKDEEGKDINPHIPQYISKAPWYLNQTVPGLKHQRFRELPKQNIDLWYQRGTKHERVEKYRKGACENCGALTHTVKDCVERPRKKGAKFTGSDICADEHVVPSLDLDFDGKRDRWAGYDPNEYKLVIHDYELSELERKRRKQLELQQQIRDSKSNRKQEKLRKRLQKLGSADAASSTLDDDHNSDSDSDSEDSVGSDDEDVRVRDFDKTSAPMGSKDDNTRTTTRNLRIREDTAKYLYNLDLDSAFYDPKSRSMRGNPLDHLKADEQTYRGDNVMRFTGATNDTQKMELFAWEAYKHNANVHFNAMPTQLEQIYQEHIDKKQRLEEEKKYELVKKYGGSEYLNAPKELIFAETERFVEYAPDGSILKGRERALIKSKYEEDVYLGSHSSVWGSWYDPESNKWGFSCCHETNRSAECVEIKLNVPVTDSQSNAVVIEISAPAATEDRKELSVLPSELRESRTAVV
ncbi:putative SLU7 splicing factor [Cardiosporidium cionae]|uniref:Pre-mRNA-splicing factor SLU7 n=1 Tax=Cardiosporidium cionae TaxID=476202 RepID=A0ABQ7JEC2_9APIC|nr:putative SLU7 splicing factor [Cardiosporidium cionae]|eukprot:KAF8822239.1 putative SLU7 splicing factor [Cardiosporidium cionae]